MEKVTMTDCRDLICKIEDEVFLTIESVEQARVNIKRYLIDKYGEDYDQRFFLSQLAESHFEKTLKLALNQRGL